MRREEIISRVRRAHPAEHSIDLVFDGCRVRVRANRKEIVEFLHQYFNLFMDDFDRAEIQITLHEALTPDIDLAFKRRKPGRGKPKAQEEWVDLVDGRIVRNRFTRMLYAFGGRDHIAVGPCLENSSHVVHFINSRYIEWRLCQGCLLGHAAGIVVAGRGLAVAGFSGMGKSTLALHLMSRGATFVSNNRLMVKKSGRGLGMYGVAEMPRINPGTILHNPNLTGIIPEEERGEYAKLSAAELWTLERKYDVPIDRCFGQDRMVLCAPMHDLIILNWKAGDEPTKLSEVDLAERSDLLPAFMKKDEVFLFPTGECHMPAFSLENYVDHLSRCTVFEVTGGRNFARAIDAYTSYAESR